MNKFIAPIKQAIEESNHNAFLVSLNYEILLPDSGKSLLHCNYYDFDSLQKLFNLLYQDKSQFLPDDIEVDLHMFRRRLDALTSFLVRRGQEHKHIKRIASTISKLDSPTISIQSITCRLLDDRNHPLFSRNLMNPQAKEVLRNFCMQKEITKNKLFEIIDQLDSTGLAVSSF